MLCSAYLPPHINIYKTSEQIFSTLNGKQENQLSVVRKHILEVQKNFKLETIIAAEVLASTFMTLIRKSVDDYGLMKKTRKSKMSVDIIPDGT